MTTLLSILGSIGTFLFCVWLFGGGDYLARRLELKHKEKLALIEATKYKNKKDSIEP